MANKIIYRDFAVGAREGASVDLSNTDQQLVPTPVGNEIEYVDSYDANSIFGEIGLPRCASFEDLGVFYNGAVDFYHGEKIGFVSSLCSNAAGQFGTSPRLDITLNSYFTVRGMSLCYWKGYATRLTLTYYRDGVNIFSKTYDESTADDLSHGYPRYFYPAFVENFNRLKIEFHETSAPNSFVKVWGVLFGREWEITTFEKIIHHTAIRPNSEDLPIGSADISFFYDVDLALRDDQQILIYQGSELLDTLYIVKSRSERDGKYSITANNSVSKLDNLTLFCPWAARHKHHVSEYLFEIESQTGIIVTTEGYDDVPLVGGLTVCSVRYALLQIAFALNAKIDISAKGDIKIMPLDITPVAEINASRYTYANYTKNDVVTQVNYSFPSYTLDTSVPVQEVAVAEVFKQPTTVIFSPPVESPYYVRDENGNNISNAFDLIKANNNCYKLKLLASNPEDSKTAYFHARRLTKNETLLSRKNLQISEYTKENIKTFDKYSICETSQAEFLDTLYDSVIANKGQVDLEFYVEGERVGDVVDVVLPDRTVRGVITSLDTTIGHNSRLAKGVVEEWKL